MLFDCICGFIKYFEVFFRMTIHFKAGASCEIKFFAFFFIVSKIYLLSQERTDRLEILYRYSLTYWPSNKPKYTLKLL